MTETFDPDKFNLSKKDILKIMDSIGRHWQRSKILKLKNAKYVMGLEAIKLGIRLSDDEVLQDIWKDILKGFNILIIENDKARMKNEFPNVADLLEITTKKIEEGSIIDTKRK